MKKTADSYISIHFSQIHNIDKIEKEYANYFRFFCGNYKRYMPVDRNAKILDMGCGLGETLFALHKLGYNNVTGIDFSQECVEFCNKMKYAKCWKGDALEYFERSSEQYDVIFFNDIIEHFLLEDVIRILKGMKRCLNRGGVILIKTMNGGNAILGTTTLYSDLTHKIMFDEFSLKEVAVVAGFSPAQIQIKKANLYCFFDNPFNYIAWACNSLISLFLRLYFILLESKKFICLRSQ